MLDGNCSVAERVRLLTARCIERTLIVQMNGNGHAGLMRGVTAI